MSDTSRLTPDGSLVWVVELARREAAGRRVVRLEAATLARVWAEAERLANLES